MSIFCVKQVTSRVGFLDFDFAHCPDDKSFINEKKNVFNETGT